MKRAYSPMNYRYLCKKSFKMRDIMLIKVSLSSIKALPPGSRFPCCNRPLLQAFFVAVLEEQLVQSVDCTTKQTALHAPTELARYYWLQKLTACNRRVPSHNLVKLRLTNHSAFVEHFDNKQYADTYIAYNIYAHISSLPARRMLSLSMDSRDGIYG